MIGTTFGHYTLLEEIGAGAMGRVYRARDSRLERDVAIKILPPLSFADPQARKRFRQEALALSKLNHPNVATIHDFDSDGELDYLVMEHISGLSLDEKIAGAPLAEREILRLGVQLAEGLDAAHQEGILHRDLKSANLRVTPEGRLKILDFGLAKLLPEVSPSASTSSGNPPAIAGTLPYMAPEQVLGEKLDPRTDLYAAGNVLYEMATGKAPFERTLGSRLIDEILHQPPVAPRALNSRISPGLENVILKCLEKSPENRYQSANELGVDLRRLTSATTASAIASRSPASLRGRWRMVLAFSVIALFALASVFYYRRWWQNTHRRAQIRSLAVLPLINVSGDPAQDYFADGMTDELISRMARYGEPRVISLTSSMRYKGTHKPLKQIANELGVDAVVEGSVLRSGTQVRITAELIDAASDQHLWANSYNRDLRNVLGLQDEVAEAVASQVRARLRPQEHSDPLDPLVYEAYLRGRFEWNKRTPEGARAALDFFRQAIAKDPDYAPAYSGIADCYLTLGPTLHAMPLQRSFSLARNAVDRALQLDPDLAEAHATLAEISLIGEWDWPKAEAEFKTSLQLNPGYATAHHWYGLYLGYEGRAPEARRQLELAHDLDPLSAIIQSNLGWSYYIERDYDNTIRVLRETLAHDPDFWVAHWGLGSSYVQKLQYTQAIAELQKAVELSQGDSGTRSSLAYAQVKAGDRKAAENILSGLQHSSQTEPVDLAIIYVAMGDRGQAMAMLQQAYREHSQSLLLLKTDPWFDPLRADPRFQELIKKIGFG